MASLVVAEQPRRKEAPTLKDPGVSYGTFRPLPRTDGKYIVYGEELPFGKRTVGGRTFGSLALADAFARECAAAPEPAAPCPPTPPAPSPT